MSGLKLIKTWEAINIMKNNGYCYSGGLQFFMHNNVIYQECGSEDQSTLFKTITKEELDAHSFWVADRGDG